MKKRIVIEALSSGGWNTDWYPYSEHKSESLANKKLLKLKKSQFPDFLFRIRRGSR